MNAPTSLYNLALVSEQSLQQVGEAGWGRPGEAKPTAWAGFRTCGIALVGDEYPAL